MQYNASAFVLKNFAPMQYKVIIIHEKLGKITCVYTKKHKAAQLCTGSLIDCVIEKQMNWYRLIDFDLQFVPLGLSFENLSCIHDIVKICLKVLPAQIAVFELFDFIRYILQRADRLTDIGRHIVMLRLFLLFDLLPESNKMYRYAQQDPYGSVTYTHKELADCVTICWNNFYQNR